MLACAALALGASACHAPPTEPGEPVRAAETRGGGACAQTTLGAVAQQVREAHPALARAGLEGDLGGDPKSTGWIDAYLRADGGFALSVTIVGPDCGERCCNHRKVYFETDASCWPVQVGEFSYGWSQDEPRCWYAEGAPRWDDGPNPSRQCATP